MSKLFAAKGFSIAALVADTTAIKEKCRALQHRLTIRRRWSRVLRDALREERVLRGVAEAELADAKALTAELEALASARLDALEWFRKQKVSIKRGGGGVFVASSAVQDVAGRLGFYTGLSAAVGAEVGPEEGELE